MPPDPKKPIEELLEASAKARRAEFGADPKMPNPMRARLHDEIARLGREDQPAERRSWLAMFWPQVSIGTAVAAVLITASVLWVGHRSDSGGESMQLAMRAPAAPQADALLKSLDAPVEGAVETEAAKTKAISGALADNTAASKPADLEAREQSDATALQKFADVAIAPTASAPKLGAAEFEAKDANDNARLTARVDETASQSAPPTTAPAERFANAAPAAAAAPPVALSQKGGAANQRQQFSQTARGQALRSNAKLKQAGNVLDTFQVEQDGREIRVVDADGSTYTGKFEPVARSAVQRRLKEEQPAPVAAADTARRESSGEAAPNEYSFRATGFNASLKKRVVFEGNYIPMPEADKKASTGLKRDGAQQGAARIVGKATVPGEAPVEVDAVAR